MRDSISKLTRNFESCPPDHTATTIDVDKITTLPSAEIESSLSVNAPKIPALQSEVPADSLSNIEFNEPPQLSAEAVALAVEESRERLECLPPSSELRQGLEVVVSLIEQINLAGVFSTSDQASLLFSLTCLREETDNSEVSMRGPLFNRQGQEYFCNGLGEVLFEIQLLNQRIGMTDAEDTINRRAGYTLGNCLVALEEQNALGADQEHRLIAAFFKSHGVLSVLEGIDLKEQKRRAEEVKKAA